MRADEVLAILADGDAYVEGHATQGHDAQGGAIIHVATARRLEALGLIETYEAGRISPYWMARITQRGRQALDFAQSCPVCGASHRNGRGDVCDPCHLNRG